MTSTRDFSRTVFFRLKEILNGILAEASGKSVEDVTKDTDRDYFMSATEAKKWGIVDKIL